MYKKAISSYFGRLSPEQIAEGMNAALRNACRLLSDAEHLLEAERYPAAGCLAILAIEEAGKTSILRGLSVAKDDKALRQYWKDYRNHKAKNAMWIFPDLVRDGARNLFEFGSIFDSESKHPQTLDIVKQLGFYTDFYGSGHCSEPEKVIDKKLACELVKRAKLLCSKREYTSQEIELWIKYLGPVWETNKMAEALIEWAHAMEKSGFDVDAEAMANFVAASEPSLG